MTLISSIRK